MARQSLDDLEGNVGTPATSTDALVVTKCQRLRKKAVDDFTIEDLRVMISQEIGLKYLMPPAILALEREPMAEGNLHPGDLLASVIAHEKWLKKNPELSERVLAIAKRAATGMGQDGFGGELLLFIARGSGKPKKKA